MALVWRVACDGFLQVLASSLQRAKVEPGRPGGIVGENRECRVGGALRQASEGFSELLRRVQLSTCIIKSPQAMQDLGKLGRLAHLLTQGVGLSVGVLHLGRCLPFSHPQGCAEANVQGQGVLDTLRCLG